MFKSTNLLAAAAVAALATAPAFALGLSAEAALGASPEDMTTVQVIEDSAFVGNEVRTKDQIVIGQVEAVYEGADGAPTAVVTLNSDIAAQSSVKSFTVPLTADSAADGSLTLGWTEGELFAALSGNLTPTQGGSDSGDDAAEDNG